MYKKNKIAIYLLLQLGRCLNNGIRRVSLSLQQLSNLIPENKMAINFKGYTENIYSYLLNSTKIKIKSFFFL